MESYANKILEEHTLVEYNVCFYLLMFLLGTLITWYIQLLWKRRKIYTLTKKIPGPIGIPFIGNLYWFTRSGFDALATLKILEEFYPEISKLWMGTLLVVFVNTPKYAEIMLTHPKSFDKPYYYSMLSEGIGDGLVTTAAQKWRKHRKLIAPSFNQRILNSFVEIFSDQSVVFVEIMNKFRGRKDVDFYHLLTKCTLEIVCQTAMGVDVQKAGSEYGEAIEKMLELTNARIFYLPHHIQMLWNLSSESKKFDYYQKIIRDTTLEVLREKKNEYDKKMKEKHTWLFAEIDEVPVKKRMAFLDLVLENANLTEDELEEEVRTFIAAGTETTASASCYVCMVLGIFPEIQEKIYEEVIEILGPDRNVLPEDLPNMKYTERVIKETLRLFPIGPLLGRYTSDDIKLDDNITVPEGTNVVINVFSMHRNPKYWLDPLRFDPDRFLPEETAKRHPCTYLPFSYGPRICIGWRYAMMSMKTLLATLVRQYKFHCDYKSIEEIRLSLQCLLRLKDGTKLWFEQR